MKFVPVEIAGLLAITTTIVYWAAGVSGDGVSPELFRVVAAGLTVGILELLASALALRAGRCRRLAQVLGIGCAAMLVVAVAGVAPGV